MCIRDSYKFDLIEKRALYSIIRNIRAQYSENENGRRDLFDDLIITIHAVSYTHLDVYKRQGMSSDRVSYLDISDGKLERAVSYTHLDVYKRQLLDFASLSSRANVFRSMVTEVVVSLSIQLRF